MLHQYFILKTPATIFLVYTGCGSGIRRYKFNFRTLYIPKKLSQVYLEWNIDVAFSKYQKNTTKQKFKISKKNWIFTSDVIFGHFWSLPVWSFLTKKLSQVILEPHFIRIKRTFHKMQFLVGQSQNVGVNYVASDSALVEACRVVGGCLSMSQFFGKTSYLNIFSLIFGNSYQ